MRSYEKTQSDLLNQIIDGEYIYPVYQPIVSLTDGKVFGYEALSRITRNDLVMNIEQLFQVADRTNKSWDLETLCRKKAIEHSAHFFNEKKLFINVNPNIIYDKKFSEGFTRSYLHKNGLDTNNIVFEITERVSVIDNRAFLFSVNHYKNQNYQIAIDDVGSGYSGLNTITDVRPNLIKLDVNLVRGIDKDKIKQLLCHAMVDFGSSAGIQVIAEGIETEEELKTLIKLRVALGQGYFLSMPKVDFNPITAEKIKLISTYNKKYCHKKHCRPIYPSIGELITPCQTLSAEEYEDVVNYNTPIVQVSHLAMQRPADRLYNPILVEKDNQFIGTVTIQDLLNALTHAV